MAIRPHRAQQEGDCTALRRSLTNEKATPSPLIALSRNSLAVTSEPSALTAPKGNE
jgi:hypothetical protein